MGISVSLVTVEDLSRGSSISVDLSYQTNFIKRSTIAVEDTLITTPRLDSQHFNVGDEVRVTAKAVDRFGPGSSSPSDPVIIENTAPKIDDVLIGVIEGTKLQANVIGLSDPDESDMGNLTVSYQWSNQNGSIRGAREQTFAGPFDEGDIVYVVATPSDGKKEGIAVKSNTFEFSESGKAGFAHSLLIDGVTVKTYRSDLPDGIPIHDPEGKEIRAQALWVVHFSASTVQFIDQSKISSMYWSWAFGDGRRSVAQNPVHKYELERNLVYYGESYPVTLTISESAGADSAMNTVRTLSDAVWIKSDKGWKPLGNRSIPNEVPLVPSEEKPFIVFDDPTRTGIVDIRDGQIIHKNLTTEQTQFRLIDNSDDLAHQLGWTPELVRSILRQVVERLPKESDEFQEGQYDYGSILHVVMPQVSAKLGDVRVEVPIEIRNWKFIEEIIGTEIVLTYDPSVLRLIDVRASDTQWESPVFDYEITEGEGFIKIAVVGVGLRKDGDGRLVEMSFNVLSTVKEESVLKLSAVQINDAKIKAIRSEDFTITSASCPDLPWDANRDGEVNILDLVSVGGHFGETIEYISEPPSENPDVNRDTRVNILDLVLVGNHLGRNCNEESVAAGPARDAENLQPSEIAVLREIYDHLDAIPDPSPDVVRLKTLLLSLIGPPPEPAVSEFKLLPNFPNPFNPETWIPYQLAKLASVTIKIYTPRGQLVRTLSLGRKDAGRYLEKDKAAYWDGRNDFGERAASGMYFYVIEAGDFTEQRTMVLVK